MNFKISNFKFQIRQGFTLVEIMAVISVAGVLVALTFVGINSFNNSQPLDNSAREVLSILRSSQNKALNGAYGQPLQIVELTNLSLSPGITITNPPTAICFVNPNLTSFIDNQCGNCESGTFFACDKTTLPGTQINSNLVLTFQNSKGETKSITIEGSGIQINRMYVQ